MNTESLRQKAIEAKALAEKASSGPWNIWAIMEILKRGDPDQGHASLQLDAKFISASRELVPELAEAVLQLLSEREKMMAIIIRLTNSECDRIFKEIGE